MSMFEMTPRKRGRDDDSDSEVDDDRYVKARRLTIHTSTWTNWIQKSRPAFGEPLNYGQFPFQSHSSLPHRPSYTPSPPRLITDIRAMTPAQSDHGGLDSPSSIYGGPVISRESSRMDEDMDMDDDNDNDVRSQPPESPAFGSFSNNFMRPPKLQPSAFNSGTVNSNGRIPTPIHATFKRGSMNGLGYPASGSAGGMDMNNMHTSSMQAPPPAWKGPRQDMLSDDRSSRRMPSPISEDEDIPDTPTALTQSQLSRLSVSQAHNSADCMDMESPPPTVEASSALPPTPRGRKRSGALTGMGRVTMGYRDDCEKCRQRVPGHFSHFRT
ncbi:hypothetical protein DDE82_004011 [Stemphylium lycopersici]|uniref:Uncharacterized protein n=1 Tax=Stemphylium lycopersici TaxID=183478 RepID=A0A364MYM7_STELY|nr:hypothetical protein TW65_03880 [Stemphylium lycopersici]RAR05265.1 hypothetical protein DDE82_004011 [Stemphylium lycopersici]RAR07162.1 hypothetical protein DDE83_006599 [Stemphylium lycopersici]